MPPSTTGIQLLAPNRMRSRLAAMFLFCNSLFGLAFGSAIVGALNDFVFQPPAAVTRSVAIVVGCAGVATVILLAARMPAVQEASLRRNIHQARFHDRDHCRRGHR